MHVLLDAHQPQPEVAEHDEQSVRKEQKLQLVAQVPATGPLALPNAHAPEVSEAPHQPQLPVAGHKLADVNNDGLEHALPKPHPAPPLDVMTAVPEQALLE